MTGANDDSVWTGDTSATAIEDAEGDTVSGNLAVADVDSSDIPAILDRSGNANYGSFTVTAATGAWTYTLFNANLDVDALDNRNDTLIDTFDTTADDGTSQTVTITIRGADDASVISGGMTGAVTEAGGENNGGIGNPTATGSLTVSDVDGDDSPTIEAQTITGVYGSLAVLEGGAWTYTLDDDDPQTQALGESHPGAEDTFAVEADDSNTVKVTITVTGADDLATFDDGNTGAVTEDARSTASGSYDIDDVDADDRPAWEPQADADGTYGTFSIAADGAWIYTLDNDDAATNALAEGVEVVDTFTVSSAHAGDDQDGTITVTITGANDPPTAPAVVNRQAVEGTAFSYTFPAFTDPEGDAVTYSASGLPGWLTFTENTRVFNGASPVAGNLRRNRHRQRRHRQRDGRLQNKRKDRRVRPELHIGELPSMRRRTRPPAGRPSVWSRRGTPTGRTSLPALR